MYTKILAPAGGLAGVRRDIDGACIPSDPDNADWREFLGWREAGNEPGEPPPAPAPVPAEVALWQARVALARRQLLAPANAAIGASGDAALQAAWEYGNTISRGSPALAALAGALSLDEATIDALFVEAAAIHV
jgi:hypothetical protein